MDWGGCEPGTLCGVSVNIRIFEETQFLFSPFHTFRVQYIVVRCEKYGSIIECTLTEMKDGIYPTLGPDISLFPHTAV